MFMVPIYLAEIVVQPQQPLKLSFAKVLIYFFGVGLLISGPIGALAHWLIVERPTTNVDRWIIRWTAGCWFSLFGVAAAAIVSMHGNVEVIEHFVDVLGVSTTFVLVSAASVLILSAILGDTRPRPGDRAPGP
jgi:hypothetical protein